MKDVRWSDNLCGPADTCITGLFTAAEMSRLLEVCPSGWFTPTFSERRLNGWDRRDINYYKERMGDSVHCHYFNFKRTEGQLLFTLLLLQNQCKPFVSGKLMFSEGYL